MRILIIEDDKKLCWLLQFRLEQEKYEADTCSDGGDAEYFLEQNAYDLVLLDREELKDTPDYRDPFQVCKGIRKVWVNGVLTAENLERVVEAVGTLQDAAMTGYLLEMKRVRFSQRTFDFDL